jgi:hypothetical protein
MNRNLVWLSARAAVALALAALTAACTGGDADETQSIEGQVARSNFEASVLGVRAVRGGEAVAWAPLTANGHFRLRVPVGEDYRLEVVTASGAHPFVGKSGEGGRNLVFDVCGAGEAFDVGHVHGWEQAGGGSDGEPGGGGGCDDPCMNDPSGCDDPCQNDPDSCQDPCPDGNCEPPCDPGPDGECDEPPPCEPGPDGECQPPCDPSDPDGDCQPPCDPSDPDGSCGPTCDDDGNCCYEDGTCCDQNGSCCYPDGTCCGSEGCCYPDGSCDPPPCDPSDPDGDCYCDEQDPGSDCYCNPDDPASYCYCNPEDPDSYCYPQPPCENPDGTTCCSDDNGGGGEGDPMCWPEPGEPPPCPDGTTDDDCWKGGAVPDNALPDFGCVRR